MLKAIESTKEDAPKFGQETNKDNLLVSSGWNRERHEDDKKVRKGGNKKKTQKLFYKCSIKQL